MPISPSINPQNPEETGNWGGAKGYMAKTASGSSGYTISKGAKAYVKAMGGARKASRAARVGKTSTARLGNFLRSISENGFEETLRRYGLADLIGQPAAKVFASIADLIAPSGATNEDANTRAAVLDALENLYVQFELENDDLTKLEALGEQDIRIAILDCCKAYIYEKWLQQLGLAIERKAITANEALAKEQEAKNFIKEAVNYDFENKSLLNMDFSRGEGKLLINNIFTEAYLILEQ
ncbi:Qat anti-phage system associated protein QatB [Adhaeribacter soli]|nr:Qat anti-phage system associated protein QatB [Adhaeribacter soli]